MYLELLVYAAKTSIDAGFDGVLFFKAKTDELRRYCYARIRSDACWKA